MTNPYRAFKLRIIHVDNIVAHEEYDVSRSGALVKKIQERKLFVNPILVAHVAGETYMQIDGMNRYSAIKHLKIKSILAQIVDYNDQNAVEVSTWSHLNKIPKKDFLDKLSAISGITIAESGYRYLRKRYIKDSGLGYLCTIVFKDLSVYRMATNGKLEDKINQLRRIVALYKNQIVRDILPTDANSVDVMQLFRTNPLEKSLVIFPTFTRHQIINSSVHKKALFPGGVTRFIIKGRCLDVNYPLFRLSEKISIEDKNKKLQEFLLTKTHRMYEEPTIYFEP